MSTDSNNFRNDRVNVAQTAERIVRETMVERGLKKPQARRVVANEIGVAPGALKRLADGSLVHVERITTRINAYVVRRLERKIAQFEHELAVARLSADRPDEAGIIEAQAALQNAKRALGK